MKVVALATLKRFWERHPDSEAVLRSWYDEVRHAVWDTPHDVRQRYASASFVANSRVVFNIKGNSCRLIVAVSYRFQVVYIKFIGTHAEYDRIDADTVELL